MSVRGLRIAITTDAVGGVWTYTLDLAAGLRDAGAVPRIIALGPALRDDQRRDLAGLGLEAVETGLPLEWLARDAGEWRDAATVIAGLVRDWSADLAHLHTPALAGAAAFDCPVAAVNHSCVATWWAGVRGGPLPSDLQWRADAVGAGLRRADLAIAPTTAYAAVVRDTYALDRAPLAIHNGRACGPAGATARSDTVFSAGRLWDEGKNIVALARAAPTLPWPVVVAGDVVAPHGGMVALDGVVPLGRLSETGIRDRLAARPIFVSPARFEPFGLTVLEAAQAGCALVLNDIATFRELWDGAARFVDATGPDALASAIRTLTDDRPRRDALGEAARRRAARYSAAASVAATIDAYAAVLPHAQRTLCRA